MPIPCHSLTVGTGRCFVHYTVFGAGQEIDFVDVDHLSVKRWNVVRIALIVKEHELDRPCRRQTRIPPRG